VKLKSVYYLSLSLLIITFISCSDDNTKKDEIVRPVYYQQIMLSGSGQNRTFSGTSQAGTEASLSFRVSGTLVSLNVKVGDQIKKGSLIATVDDSDAQIKYEKSLVALEKSRVQKETAKSSLDRMKGLYENNNVSLQDYEIAKSSYATANAAYEADKNNVDLQERSLTYYKLYAPMDGIVTAVNAEKNENVSPGRIIAVMNTGDDMEVNVGVPENFISKLKVGSNVTVKFTSIPDKIFDARITEVAYNISSQSSIYPVTVSILAPTSDVRPGMSAKVSFSLNEKSSTTQPKIIAPVAAVGKDTVGNFVFVLKKESESIYIAEKRRINIGELLPEGFEIISGINENELVATAGLNSLMDGMKVRLLEN
jgi:multidrug efflux system membrane fusion protein